MNDENSLFVKLTKPQLLLMEQMLKEAVVVYCVAVVLFLIAGVLFDFDSWGGFARLFDSMFTAAIVLCVFFAVLPYLLIRWNYLAYKLFRKEIMEEDLK